MHKTLHLLLENSKQMLFSLVVNTRQI